MLEIAREQARSKRRQDLIKARRAARRWPYIDTPNPRDPDEEESVFVPTESKKLQPGMWALHVFFIYVSRTEHHNFNHLVSKGSGILVSADIRGHS